VSSPFDAVDVDVLRRRRTVKWQLYGDDVLAAWVAEMDFDVAPAVRAAIIAAVDREDFGYVEPDLSELTTACAAFCADRFGWEVQPARVFPIADVLRGIWAALDVFAPPASPVVVPTPAYPPFFEVIELTGRTVVPVPLVVQDGRDTLDVAGIDAALAAGARTVLLCSPHNPTGRVFARDELAALADVVARHDARVIADEVHAALTHPGATHVPYSSVSDAAARHSVTVTSASKAFNVAGLKCAQLIATNHDDATRLRALQVHEVPGPTPIGIAASTAAYRDGGAWLDELIVYLAGNRARLVERLAADLPGVTCRAPEATFLAWLDCRALGLDDPARFFLEEAKVAVSDGPPFGPGCEQQVRLNYGTSRAVLDQVIDAMATAARRAPGPSPATTR
jgi:cystathionine beta-lyase